MKGTLSKKQRERKQNRQRMNEILGDRLHDWTQFVKKDNDSQLTEEQRDRKEGERLVKEMDEETKMMMGLKQDG